MAIDSVLFDLDGTLIDSHPGILRSLQEALEAVLPEQVVPIPKDVIGPPVRKIYRSLLGDIDESLIIELEKRFRDIYDNTGACLDSKPFETVKDTLAALNKRGINCYILTNKPMKPTMRILKHLELDTYFAAILTPDVSGTRFKTKTETAEYALKQYGFIKENTLVIGDSRDDAEAAHDCGFHFFPVKYGYGNAHRENGNALSTLADLLTKL